MLDLILYKKKKCYKETHTQEKNAIKNISGSINVTGKWRAGYDIDVKFTEDYNYTVIREYPYS